MSETTASSSMRGRTTANERQYFPDHLSKSFDIISGGGSPASQEASLLLNRMTELSTAGMRFHWIDVAFVLTAAPLEDRVPHIDSLIKTLSPTCVSLLGPLPVIRGTWNSFRIPSNSPVTGDPEAVLRGELLRRQTDFERDSETPIHSREEIENTVWKILKEPPVSET